MRRKHRLITFIVCMVLIAGSGILGYGVARKQPRIVEEKEIGEEAVEAAANPDRITSQTKVNLYTTYEMCNHKTFESFKASKDMIGLTLTEFSEKFPETRVLEFSEDTIVIENSYICYCPEHLTLKKNGSLLSVFRTRAGSSEQYIYYETNVNTYKVDKEELDVLRAGKLFSSMQEVYDYLEKIETD